VWYGFRRRLAPFLERWNQQILHLAIAQVVTTATEAVTDGTLSAASALRHRLLNQERMTTRLQELETACEADLTNQPLEKSGWLTTTPGGRRLQRKRCQRAAELLQRRLEANRRRRASDRLEEKHVVISASDPESAWVSTN
jgi:hypothetical protein